MKAVCELVQGLAACLEQMSLPNPSDTKTDGCIKRLACRLLTKPTFKTRMEMTFAQSREANAEPFFRP